MRRTPGNSTSEAMQGVFKGMEGGGKRRESLALAYWDKAVGAKNAAASEAVSVLNGVLTVRTKHPTWSHHLSQLQHEIIPRLNRLIGKPVITEIRFRASEGISKEEYEERADAFPTDEELEQVELTGAESKMLEKEIESLEGMSDKKVLEAVRRRLIREQRLYRWRLEHGWRACGKCGSLHLGDGDDCPLCNLGL